MKNNKSKGKKAGKVFRFFGLLLLLAAVFAGMYMLLTGMKESYAVPEETAVSEEKKVPEEAVPAEEKAETKTEEQAEAAPEQKETERSEEEEKPAETEQNAEAEAAPAYQETQPEKEDGSGEAGLRRMEDSVKSLSDQKGWFRNDLNAWYSPDAVHYYYNGWVTVGDQRFHFDTAGMVDRGWKTIGGQEYYFDENGVYQPDAVKQ